MRIRPAIAVLAALALASPAAAAAEAPFVDATPLLLPAPGSFLPSAEDDCVSGKPKCVRSVIREMTRRFDRQAASCDHDAMFALTYLRTTEEYERAMLTPGFFADPNFVNHEDAVFARYYFDAVDAWDDGRTSEVPQAWRIALDAADRRSVTSKGNLLLGINAHINRDLPYVLAGIGLVRPDGRSRKADHDKVNEFLDRVTAPLYEEIARRFDPTVDDSDLPTELDDMATFQAFPAMRENAWRNAERLVAARTPMARALAERAIEETATAAATAIVAATRANAAQVAARDAYCAVNNDDRGLAGSDGGSPAADLVTPGDDPATIVDATEELLPDDAS